MAVTAEPSATAGRVGPEATAVTLTPAQLDFPPIAPAAAAVAVALAVPPAATEELLELAATAATAAPPA